MSAVWCLLGNKMVVLRQTGAELGNVAVGSGLVNITVHIHCKVRVYPNRPESHARSSPKLYNLAQSQLQSQLT
jgi:hypothetical protein